MTKRRHCTPLQSLVPAAYKPSVDLNQTYNVIGELSQHSGMTPNQKYDCGNYQCLKVTVMHNNLSYALGISNNLWDGFYRKVSVLNQNFRILHDGITAPTDPIVDMSIGADRVTLYAPSPYGHGTGSQTIQLIPVKKDEVGP